MANVALELTMTPTSKAMVRQLVADVLMEGFPRPDNDLVESEMARKILDAIEQTEKKIQETGYAAPSVLGALKDTIKEFCEQQIKKEATE